MDIAALLQEILTPTADAVTIVIGLVLLKHDKRISRIEWKVFPNETTTPN